MKKEYPDQDWTCVIRNSSKNKEDDEFYEYLENLNEHEIDVDNIEFYNAIDDKIHASKVHKFLAKCYLKN